MSVYQSLEREWRQIGASTSAARHLARWASVEPALAGYSTPAEVLVDIAAPGHAERAHQLLGCLLRHAHDPVAARAFLQAILPALRAARAWPSVQDPAERVAVTWEVICAHAGESPRYPARFIVRIAERRLRTDREAHRRRAARLELIDPEAFDTASSRWGVNPDIDDARPASEQIAMRVIDAFRSGKLNGNQARLLYATAVVGLRAVEAGRVQGLASRSVYRALDAAEATLIRVSA